MAFLVSKHINMYMFSRRNDTKVNFAENDALHSMIEMMLCRHTVCNKIIKSGTIGPKNQKMLTKLERLFLTYKC